MQMRLFPYLSILLSLLPTGSARPALMGDVDGDARVTIQDVLRLLPVVTGRQDPNGREHLLGDLWPNRSPRTLPGRWTTGDGRITLHDLFPLLRTAVGLSPAREIGPVIYDVAGTGPLRTQQPKVVLASASPWLAMDGPAEEVYLFDPWDIAIGRDGSVYFTEDFGNRVRVLEPDGTVRTLAGEFQKGFRDGAGGEARFFSPNGIALLEDESLVIADKHNHAIRRVFPDGTVTTIAGNGRPGASDGTGADARFYSPNGVSTDPSGNIYVADTYNNLIRKIAPDGAVTTIAGDGRPGLLDGPATEARFYNPAGVLFDRRDGSIFVADTSNHALRKITPDGQVTTLAGDGRVGHQDGKGANVRFQHPYGVDIDPQGKLWIADWLNGSLRVMQPDGKVETVAGRLPEGYVEGPIHSVRFHGLMNVRVAPNGLLYLTDTDNQRIRVLAP